MKALVIALVCVLVSCASAQQFLTKMELELDDLTGMTQLDNTNGTAVVVTISNSTGIVVSRYAAAGVYLPNMTIVMGGGKFNLSYNTNYTYNLSTVYGDFLYNFTTPVYRIDTSSGDAVAGDILATKKAWVDGSEITGSIANCAADGSGLCYVSQAFMSLLETNLISANIKNGTSIFGIAGNSNVLNTSDATATNDKLLSGYTCYAAGNLRTGSIATQTLSSSSVTVPAGYYSAANLSVVNSNLTAGNIKSAVSIFGLTGTYAGTGGALLRTGQTWCYDASAHQTCPVTGFPRQDADINGATAKSFTDNGDGTVTDTQTGIMWTKADNGPTLTWANALIYCNGLSTGGYTNWHLPNFVEMATLIDFGPSGYKNAAFTWSGDYYWTSTTPPSVPSVAYFGDFYGGIIVLDYKSVDYFYSARCART